jgi:DNA-binding transcriptional LysR family regulator
VSARGTTARGALRVGAPMELGRRRIGPLLAEFAALHPALEVHLALSDAGLEVGEDGLDVALRIGRPEDQAVITRKIASTKRIVCAAPSYLAARGTQARPADLAAHECLRLARRHRLLDRWRFRTESGVEEIKVGGYFPAAAATFCTHGRSKDAAFRSRRSGTWRRILRPDGSSNALRTIGVTASISSPRSCPGGQRRHGFGCSWTSSPRPA